MQPSFFDHQDRLELLERLGDPLPKLERTIHWEAFREVLRPIYKGSDPRKGGRPPNDAVLMFKVLVLQQFYNLSDGQTEFQIRDRYSFCRFLGLSPEGRVPGAGCRVPGAGCWVPDAGCRMPDAGCRMPRRSRRFANGSSSCL